MVSACNKSLICCCPKPQEAYLRCGEVVNNQIKKGLLLSLSVIILNRLIFGKVTSKKVVVSATTQLKDPVSFWPTLYIGGEGWWRCMPQCPCCSLLSDGVCNAPLICLRRMMLRYDTRCCFNVHSKADTGQLNLPHRTNK